MYPLISQENLGFICQRDLSEAYQHLTKLSASLPSSIARYRFGKKRDLLSISRSLPWLLPQQAASQDLLEAHDLGNELLGLEESDDLAVYHPSHKTLSSSVEYQIIYSPSYRVPVLYLLLHNLPSPGPKGIDAVYEYLVPRGQHEILQELGVLGGIGMIVSPPRASFLTLGANLTCSLFIQNHPGNGLPCPWVHPCNTAEAMREIISSMKRQVSPQEYLMIWIGLVGNTVGLTVPKELALAMKTDPQ